MADARAKVNTLADVGVSVIKLTVRGNPLTDITVLRRIALVVKAGKRVK